MMTKEEFKRRWDSDERGGGITYDDCAECAKAWGLCQYPRIMRPQAVAEMVAKAAGCEY